MKDGTKWVVVLPCKSQEQARFLAGLIRWPSLVMDVHEFSQAQESATRSRCWDIAYWAVIVCGLVCAILLTIARCF